MCCGLRKGNFCDIDRALQRTITALPDYRCRRKFRRQTIQENLDKSSRIYRYSVVKSAPRQILRILSSPGGENGQFRLPHLTFSAASIPTGSVISALRLLWIRRTYKKRATHSEQELQPGQVYKSAQGAAGLELLSLRCKRVQAGSKRRSITKGRKTRAGICVGLQKRLSKYEKS